LLQTPSVEVEKEPEQLSEIPIELGEFLAPEPEVARLPEEDPIAFIEQQVPAAGAAAAKPKPEPRKPALVASSEPSVAPATAASSQTNSAEATASAPPSTSVSSAPSAPGLGLATTTSSAEPLASAPALSTSASPGDAPPALAPPGREAIDDPVLLAGRAATLEKSPSNVAVTLYADRIRGHALGQRVADLLPRLPQWEDFFGGSSLNPVRDFDRIALFGPSFSRSADLVVAVQYNVPQAKVRASVDKLVARQGSWLKRTPIPIAHTFADRAERLVLLPKKGFALVIPPALKEQALKANLSSIPASKGSEAAVVSIANPRAPLARFGLQVPESLSRIRAKITPLENGAVELTLIATDADESKARADAEQLTRSLNAGIQLLSGVSNVLSRLGLGSFAAGAQFEPVELVAQGNNIVGHQVLTAAQVEFILDRVERQLTAMARSREQQTRPAASQK
jgi:hypothetical protein